MKPETPTDLPAAVWRILQFHEGECNRITKSQIAVEIYGKYTESIDRNIRDAVAGLVTNNHRPIVATSDGAGYFVARTMREADHAIAELESRIGALQARKRGIITGLTGRGVGQASFF